MSATERSIKVPHFTVVFFGPPQTLNVSFTPSKPFVVPQNFLLFSSPLMQILMVLARNLSLVKLLAAFVNYACAS